MNLGVTNFRIFKNRQEFEIKPITIFTGPNNSGKSAFTKLLELLKLNQFKLDFENGRHNLGAFKNAVNWSSREHFFCIDFDGDPLSLFPDSKIEIKFKDGFSVGKKIFFGMEEILDFEQFDLLTDADGTFLKGAEYSGSTQLISKMSINLSFIINKILSKKILIKWDLHGNQIIYKYLSDVKVDNDLDINFKNYKDDNTKISKEPLLLKSSSNSQFDLYSSIASNEYYRSVFALNNEIDKLINSKSGELLFEIYESGENISSRFYDLLLSSQIEKSQDSEYIPYDSDNTIELEKNIEDGLRQIFFNIRKEIENKLINHGEDLENLTIVESPLYHLIFNERIESWDLLYNLQGKPIINNFIYHSNILSAELGSIEFLSALRGNQQRVIMNNGETEMDRILKDFANKKEIPDFVYKAFKIFGIDGELQIEGYENTISLAYLISGDKKTSFADLGFGYAQVLPIILKIAKINATDYEISNKKYLIIEEPEANLHPNLQSKLADLFVLAVSEYPGINIIIETHSEYIIRKMQYLTAQNAVQKNNVIVYYFNSDKYVSSTEPKVKRIEINSNGSLTEEFGPGFFDEAIRLRFDLIKLNSEQLN